MRVSAAYLLTTFRAHIYEHKGLLRRGLSRPEFATQQRSTFSTEARALCRSKVHRDDPNAMILEQASNKISKRRDLSVVVFGELDVFLRFGA